MTTGFAWTDGQLDRRAVVTCALSRICGVCSETLARPIVFVVDPDAVTRNALHLPPLHASCADVLTGPNRFVVRTSGFEFVGPVREDLDPRPRFEPNSIH